MANNDKVLERLRELVKEGATVKRANPDGTPTGDALVESEIDSLQQTPSAFNAWVSWTKSF